MPAAFLKHSADLLLPAAVTVAVAQILPAASRGPWHRCPWGYRQKTEGIHVDVMATQWYHVVDIQSIGVTGLATSLS